MVLKIEFDENFERKFRELAMSKYGYTKGSIKKAGEEAIKLWIQSIEKELPGVKDPVSLVRGIMSKFKKEYNSVKLQHESLLWEK